MKNFAESEIYKTYEEKRSQFTPYGFSCEKWIPKLMNGFDRHNEIEINFIPSGSLTYLMRDHAVSIPCARIALFWGLYPHRIVNMQDAGSYYVVTIPLSVFLSWRLSASFIDEIMKGGVVIDGSPSDLDCRMFELWCSDLADGCGLEDIVRSEVHCRVRRLEKSGSISGLMPISVYEGKMYHYVERMAMYISSNFKKNITVAGVAGSVGLHPDYANSIFRRVFCHPISEHIAIERIANAQRRLLFSSDHISTIAYEVGYETLSSFNRAFKKLTGRSPRSYRADMGVITSRDDQGKI